MGYERDARSSMGKEWGSLSCFIFHWRREMTRHAVMESEARQNRFPIKPKNSYNQKLLLANVRLFKISSQNSLQIENFYYFC
jgi:hypothetical protein